MELPPSLLTSIPTLTDPPPPTPDQLSLPIIPSAPPSPISAGTPSQTPPPVPTAVQPSPTPTPTPNPTATLTPTLTATVPPSSTPTQSVSAQAAPLSSTHTAQSPSLLEDYTIVSFYGRCFSPNPPMDSVAILGRLGLYDNFEAFYAAVTEYAQEVDAYNDEKGVIPAMNIIYELASGNPRAGGGTFLINVDAYLKAFDAGSLEEDYIQPAAEKGVLVFLDNQLGLSSVYEQTEHMLHFIEDYDNVHFFFDAEFHIYPSQYASGAVVKPGSPRPGQIDADDINSALELLSAFKRTHGVTREVIVGLHGFQDINVEGDTRDMIIGKNDIVIPSGITVVIDADGFSPSVNSQHLKWVKYMGITDPEVYDIFARGAYPAIKIFPPNPYVSPSMYDYDLLMPQQLMGIEPIRSGEFFTRPPAMIIVN